MVFPDFSVVDDIDVRKQQFFDYLQEYIAAENQELAVIRQSILEFHELTQHSTPLSPSEHNVLMAIASDFDIPESFETEREIVNELLIRVDQIPASLVLAQAANESAWGTSRFTIEGLNIFGQWCYEQGCGIVPRRRPSGATHEVRAFDTLTETVHGYFMNLNTHPGYRLFRQMRAQMRRQQRTLDSFELAYGLGNYSQRGDHYIDEIQTIIVQNDLTSHDHHY